MAQCVTTVRVRYAETDKMGVVYHANYFVWFEVGRCEWLRATGWSYRELEAEGVALPVIEAADDDELEIHVDAHLLSPARVAFDYEVVRRPDGASLAKGRTVHAAVNGDGRPRRLPERVLAVFA
jgi:acyl-CoA thioester hydrolase